MDKTWKKAIFFLSAALAASFPALVEAAEPVPQGCAEEFEKLEFSARFSWADSAEPMRVRVGRASRQKGSAWIAQLSTDAKGCFAYCTVRNFERLNPVTPVALNLECRSGVFAALTAPTTILWNREGKAELLRFGTWLNGFEQTRLTVDQDSYAPAQVLPRSLAEAK